MGLKLRQNGTGDQLSVVAERDDRELAAAAAMFRPAVPSPSRISMSWIAWRALRERGAG
jgi:hypothetical protein